MKIFIKKNKILCLSLLAIFLYIAIVSISYKVDFLNLQDAAARNIEYCKNNMPEEFCSQFAVPDIPDTISIFFQLIVDYPLRIFAYLIFPIFIIIPVVSDIYNEVKTGYIRNALTRMTYKNFISKIYLKSLKSLIVLPFFILVLFISSYILSGGNLIIPTEETAIIAQQYLDNFLQFSLIYILNIFLINWFIVNLAYIATIKSNHIISAIIGAYLGFLMVWIALEAIIGHAIQKYLYVEQLTNSLAISNFWIYDHVISLPFMICYALVLSISSGIIAYIVSKNKERVVLSAEKTV